jgi:hypothetical protein
MGGTFMNDRSPRNNDGDKRRDGNRPDHSRSNSENRGAPRGGDGPQRPYRAGGSNGSGSTSGGYRGNTGSSSTSGGYRGNSDRGPQRDNRGGPGERRDLRDDRPQRGSGGERPQRTYDDRPKRTFDDRPKRSFDDRPKRDIGSDRPQRSFDSDRPKRTFDDRPKRDAPGDRPQRSFDSDRPKRSFDDRPKRTFDDRPKRDFGGDRPQRSNDDRPKRSFDDRPKRDFGSDRPQRDGGPPRSTREGSFDRGGQGGGGSFGRGGTRGGGRSDRGGVDREWTEAERLQHELRPVRSAHWDPQLPDEVVAKDLHPGARNELKTLDKELADIVARHLAMVGMLIESDPELAHQHAISASRKAGRIPVARETLAITCYVNGDFATALRELRTYRRLSGSEQQLAMMIDCERALGRPEKGIETGHSVDVKKLSTDVQVQVAISMSGARLDLGQTQQALFELEIPQLDPLRAFSWSPELFAAYAAVLTDLGRDREAVLWQKRAEVAEAALDEQFGGTEMEVIEIEEEYSYENDLRGVEIPAAHVSEKLRDAELQSAEIVAAGPTEIDPTYVDPIDVDPTYVDPTDVDPSEQV